MKLAQPGVVVKTAKPGFKMNLAQRDRVYIEANAARSSCKNSAARVL
jgi:hypothetical protein